MMTPRERWYRVSSHPPKWPDRACKEFIRGSGTIAPLDQEPYGLKAIADYVGVPEYVDPSQILFGATPRLTNVFWRSSIVTLGISQ
jgi:hypothetical protein